MQKDKENPQCASIEPVHGPSKLSVPEERRQELEQVHQKLCVHRPAPLLLLSWLLLLRNQNSSRKYPVANNFEPGVGEAGSFGRPEDVQHVAVGSEDLEIDHFQNLVRSAELQK